MLMLHEAPVRILQHRGPHQPMPLPTPPSNETRSGGPSRATRQYSIAHSVKNSPAKQ